MGKQQNKQPQQSKPSKQSKQSQQSKPSKQSKQSQQSKPSKQSKQSSDAFVDDDVVSAGASNYMKLEKGDNKFRVISKPITGWIVWEENEEGKRKPVRSQLSAEPDAPSDDPMDAPKKFMAFAVIDRSDNEVKILEITQQSVIKAIKALSGNPDWGNPFSYDITITKTGKSKKTRYAVNQSPKKPLEKALILAAGEKPVNLDALYDGENPFEVDGEATEYHFK